MTAVEIAERNGRKRALAFLLLAAMTLAVMVYVANGRGGDFGQGLWFGLVFGSAVNLLPVKRWLQPNNEVLRLMDDEGARENRRLSCTVGFWAAVIAAMGLGLERAIRTRLQRPSSASSSPPRRSSRRW